MSFNSIEFIAFFIIALVFYYALPRSIQPHLLLAASLLFCLTAGAVTLICVVITAALTYISARRVEQAASQGRKTLRAVIFWSYLGAEISILALQRLIVPNMLPLGLSFYTLGATSYVIDVYRGKIRAERRIDRIVLLIAFFPALVQGPISRYDKLSPTLFSPHEPRWSNISRGILRISWGLFKKLVIADTLAPLTANLVGKSGAYVILLVIAYAAQIYADFSGGIDVCIGASRAFGIELAENFNRPFSAITLKEYWKRWHITLGAYFEEYVFYPLSVCRPVQKLMKYVKKRFGRGAGKRVAVYSATLATWLLTGLWHGFAANFAAWGLINGAALIISHESEPIYERIHARFPRLCRSRVYSRFCAFRTFIIIGIFRLLDLYSVDGFLRALGSIFTDTASWRELLTGGTLRLGIGLPEYTVIGIAIFSVWLVSRAQIRREMTDREPISQYIASKPAALCACVSALTVITLVFGAYGIGYNATDFIYSQF
jgi:D-alanyl-lipoteichoic acid acyltransferase DltB (MBOAT superfamily)